MLLWITHANDIRQKIYCKIGALKRRGRSTNYDIRLRIYAHQCKINVFSFKLLLTVLGTFASDIIQWHGSAVFGDLWVSPYAIVQQYFWQIITNQQILVIFAVLINFKYCQCVFLYLQYDSSSDIIIIPIDVGLFALSTFQTTTTEAAQMLKTYELSLTNAIKCDGHIL